MRRYVSALLMLVLLASCRSEQVIAPEGTVISREFTFDLSCDALSVFNTFDVILDETVPPGKVVVETDAAVMEYVRVKSGDEHLSIRLKGRWSVSPVEMVVRVSPERFNEFNATGACEIICERPFNVYDVELAATGASTIIFSDLRASEVEADATGTSTIVLGGVAGEADLSATGVSTVTAHELVCRKAEVQATGTSVISVNATETLEGTSVGVSEVRYTGNPHKISVRNVGMSSCRRMEP